MTVIVPTNDVYAKIIDDESNSYLTGENNDQLTELFLDLLNNTWMLSLHDTDNRILLVKYYKAQVRLFFNVLHCQKQTVLESDEIKQDIQDLLIEINTGFTEGQIKKEEALLEFLRKCSVEIQAEYISKFIKENLIQTV